MPQTRFTQGLRGLSLHALLDFSREITFDIENGASGKIPVVKSEFERIRVPNANVPYATRRGLSDTTPDWSYFGQQGI